MKVALMKQRKDVSMRIGSTVGVWQATGYCLMLQKMFVPWSLPRTSTWGRTDCMMIFAKEMASCSNQPPHKSENAERQFSNGGVWSMHLTATASPISTDPNRTPTNAPRQMRKSILSIFHMLQASLMSISPGRADRMMEASTAMGV